METMRLRAYQQRLVHVALSYNTVVILPTGAGKTLIAGELFRRKVGPSVFFVPACVLVEQQADALRSWTQLSVGKYMGGLSFPSTYDILVTTPKAFESAQVRGTAPPYSTKVQPCIFSSKPNQIKCQYTITTTVLMHQCIPYNTY